MTLSPSLKDNPNLDTWLHFTADRRVLVNSGKVELGQKVKIAMAILVAEELDVDLSRVVLRETDTDTSPNEAYTAGSNSLENGGLALRQACAFSRRSILHMASELLDEPVEQLRVQDGDISGHANATKTSYWELMGDRQFDCAVDEAVPPKDFNHYRQVGKSQPGWGFEEIATGTHRFMQDFDAPNMAHARVVRPPNYLAKLTNVDIEPVRAMPGIIDVVRDGSFLAVAAEREEQAVRAAAKLKLLAEWDTGKSLNASVDIFEQLRANPKQSRLVIDGIPQDGAIPQPPEPDPTATTLSATYRRPYHMHGSIGPSAGAAHFDGGRLYIWSLTQGIFPLRAALATVLEIPVDDIKVTHVPGSGAYGHNGAEDAALDAALIARVLAGRPVLVKWEREDEHMWEPYGSAMQIELAATLDKDGGISHWRHETYSDTHIARPRASGTGYSQLLAAWHLETPKKQPKATPNMLFNGALHRNADPIYAFGNKHIVKHLVEDLPLRTSALRTLGAYGNIFALESFLDEIANARDLDPLDLRLEYLKDERARAVLEAAARGAEWRNHPLPDGHGRGLAFARYKVSKCYAAVVINLEVNDDGAIKLNKAVIAADAGQIVDREGLKSQLEGGLIQSASWTLKEQVTFDSGGITSTDWETYPILKFNEVPEIETVLIDRPDQPILGAGEGTTGPTAAAIGNAVFDAIGIRLRTIPFTPENVRVAAAG